MRAREGGEDELAGVGMARVEWACWLQSRIGRRDARRCRRSRGPGSTPCVYMLSAIVTMSTLPVRSPLPNSVPSMRSAPARRPSSAGGHAGAAVVVRVQADDRPSRGAGGGGRTIRSVGVDVGRGDLDRGGQVEDDLPLAASGPRRPSPPRRLRARYSSSVPEKLSGEYSRTHVGPGSLRGGLPSRGACPRPRSP